MSQKGSAYEREICELLSKWWTNGVRTDIFWRTATSGGRAKKRGRAGKSTKNQHGDITATDPIGQPLIDLITIEIKRGYSKYSFADMIDKPAKAAKQQWEKWYEQVRESQKLAGTKYWMLITKRDKRVPLVFIPRKLANAIPNLVQLGGFADKSLVLFDVQIEGRNLFVLCITLSCFLDKITPQMIRKLAKG